MTKYVHVRTNVSQELPVSAEAYWNAIADWFNLLEWLPKLKEFGISRVEAKPGHVSGKLPCTRLIYPNPAMVSPDGRAPEPIVETQLHVDPEVRVMYYVVENREGAVRRNYLVCQEVDELGPDRCRTTIVSRFEVVEGFEDEQKARILAVHDAVINNIAETILKQSGTVG